MQLNMDVKMKKLTYTAPTLEDLGTVSGITAIRGQIAVFDTELNAG